MPTLLHISDLHRTAKPRVGNEELFSAITSDAGRWEQEGIPKPDVVVVSGDIIYGASADAEDPDSEIVAQYAEATDFLERLAAAFVDSDRSRVVIVPGNHDVHWGRARKAMQSLAQCPDGIARKALEASSTVRWDWRGQQAFEINDWATYDSRLEHFRKFRENFYAGLDPNPLLHGDRDLVFVEHLSMGLVIVGFASWHGNDCFCHVGEIDPASLALSQSLIANSKAPIAVAVWHHSIVGGPRANDYMDKRVIHRLIDFGFSVGLHGHQHYPDAAPYELRLPNLTPIVIVAAGSLAVGDNELPMGEHRQFNVVTLEPESESITVHVREMSPAGVFTGSHRAEFGGNTYIKLDLPQPPSRPKGPTTLRQLDEAATAVTSKRYSEALEALPEDSTSYRNEIRQIKIEALDGLGQHEKLIRLLDPPTSAGEVVRLISLLCGARRFDKAKARLEAASELVDDTLFHELSERIAVERMAYESD